MKIKLASIALSGVMLLSSAVSAAGLDFDPKLYVGGEIQADKYKGSKEIQSGKTTVTSNKGLFSKTVPAASLIVGSQLNEYCAVEAGATVASSIKGKLVNKDTTHAFTDASSAKLKSRNIHADLLGMVPVSDQFQLIGSVGLGRLSSKVKGYTQEKQPANSPRNDFTSKSSKAGVRVGAGVGLKLDDNVSARLMVRHQKGNKHIKNINSAGVGLFYQF